MKLLDMSSSGHVRAMARTVGRRALVALMFSVLGPVQLALGQPVPCVNILHDEIDEQDRQKGPINAIMLANLLGHWPHYEIRVRPIQTYQPSDLETCKATIYLSTTGEAEVPQAFLSDYFDTQKAVAWVGFGPGRLDARRLELTFQHRVSGHVTIEDRGSKEARFYQYVAYKGSLFRKDVITSNGQHEGAFEAVRFIPVSAEARAVVVADLIHNGTYDSTPYVLRAGNKFLIGDIPFAYMHESDRYFAFADLLFDILGEQPRRSTHFAFARTEDIHGLYDRGLLRAAFSAMRTEGVPISIAHIPLFMDPFNAFGQGKIETPRPAHDEPAFRALIAELAKDPRNAIVWHGTTHQFGLAKNPHTGTSGDDYEFWDMVAQRPVAGDGVAFTLDRLADGLRVFEQYKIPPRYWVTPHYHSSAVNNRVFGAVFPWTVGRVTYFPSSFKPAFTLKAVDAGIGAGLPSVDQSLLSDLKKRDWGNLDERSQGELTQMFPFEIYRDVYGQRVIPETLGYLSFATTDQTAFVRTPEDMLADARRNLVVRDYWASFFFHPYIFAPRDEGGVGRHRGDTLELRTLLIGMKLLGYQFVALSEFEATLAPERSMPPLKGP
jgi:uncharacterized protein YdaL